MDDKLNFNLPEIKADLIVGISECNKRGLIYSGKFCETMHLFTFCAAEFFFFKENGSQSSIEVFRFLASSLLHPTPTVVLLRLSTTTTASQNLILTAVNSIEQLFLHAPARHRCQSF